MLFLVLTVILNILILIIFRYLSHFSVNTFQTIVVNYFVCVFTGVAVTGKPFLVISVWSSPWIWMAAILGAVFVTSFFLIARVTQLYSISIASLASKVSLAIPVIFSMWVFKTQLKAFDVLNYLGLLLTFFAITLSSIRKDEKFNVDSKLLMFFLPATVFIISGFIDTSVNFVNIYYLRPDEANIFPLALFLSAALSGSIIFLFQKKKIDVKSIPWGIGLGIINYFSVVFLLKTLTHFGNDGAFTFPIVNLSIILFSTILSRFIFKENLSRFQLTGLITGFIALILVSYQELLSVITQ